MFMKNLKTRVPNNMQIYFPLWNCERDFEQRSHVYNAYMWIYYGDNFI